MLTITFNAWFTIVWGLSYLVAIHYQDTILYGAIANLFKNITMILVLTILVLMLLLGGELTFHSAITTPLISFQANT